MEEGGCDEKQLKRAAANVNERRRMQNINNGFETLREMVNLPNKAKLSKSAILRHTVEMARNLISENRQLKEQNKFLRNLINSNNSNQFTPPLQGEMSLKRRYSDDCNDQYNNNNIPADFSPVNTLTKDFLEINNVSERDCYELSGEKKKCNGFETKNLKKYSVHVEKLLSSPRRITRSSVITKNYAYSDIYPLNFQTPTSLESPTRRSSRLFAKDNSLMTPPFSGGFVKTSSSGDHVMTPLGRQVKTPIPSVGVVDTHSKYNFDSKLITTPEYIKNIPPRSAKRSLEAIIQAIDHIENE